MVLQAALGPIALQDLALFVVLHARVAAEHALLCAAVGAVPLTLGHLLRGEEVGHCRLFRGGHVRHMRQGERGVENTTASKRCGRQQQKSHAQA